MTTYSVWFTAKYDAADADSAAVIRKGKTAGLTGVTVMTDPATQTYSRIKVAFDPTDTAALPAKLLTLVFDIQIKAPTGEVFTVADGELQIKPDVTITTV